MVIATRIIKKSYSLVLMTMIIYIIILISYFFDNNVYKIGDYLIFLIASVAILSYILFNEILEKKALPISHNIAIIGFPQSGKTTMIISLFGEIFAGNILSVRATPKGVKSIERINESLEKLQKGRALGPTKDQDRFAFRADMTVKKGSFPRTYKVEFGDFPGEDSEEYTTKYGSWVHTNEFFKWAVDADAIIFVIDLGHYLRDDSRQDYVAKMSSAFRAAWQNILDLNENRKNDLRKFPIVLTFTKADLFGIKKNVNTIRSLEGEIIRLGFGDKIPQIEEIDPEDFTLGRLQVLNDFEDLIQYFENESSHFKVLFISSFGLYDNKRMGISDLVQAVLP